MKAFSTQYTWIVTSPCLKDPLIIGECETARDVLLHIGKSFFVRDIGYLENEKFFVSIGDKNYPLRIETLEKHLDKSKHLDDVEESGVVFQYTPTRRVIRLDPATLIVQGLNESEWTAVDDDIEALRVLEAMSISLLDARSD